MTVKGTYLNWKCYATVYTTYHYFQNNKNYCTLLLIAMIDIHVFNNSNKRKIPTPKLPEWHTSDIWIPNLSVVCIYINFCTCVCWYIHRSKNLIRIQSRFLITNTITHNQLLKQTHIQCMCIKDDVHIIHYKPGSGTDFMSEYQVAIFEKGGRLNPKCSRRRVHPSPTISARLDRTFRTAVNALQLCLWKFSHKHSCHCWHIYVRHATYYS